MQGYRFIHEQVKLYDGANSECVPSMPCGRRRRADHNLIGSHIRGRACSATNREAIASSYSWLRCHWTAADRILSMYRC